jgi:hypothetical protein
MYESSIIGITFFAPMIVISFGYVGYYAYRQYKDARKPMAKFNKRVKK